MGKTFRPSMILGPFNFSPPPYQNQRGKLRINFIQDHYRHYQWISDYDTDRYIFLNQIFPKFGLVLSRVGYSTWFRGLRTSSWQTCVVTYSTCSSRAVGPSQRCESSTPPSCSSGFSPFRCFSMSWRLSGRLVGRVSRTGIPGRFCQLTH